MSEIDPLLESYVEMIDSLHSSWIAHDCQANIIAALFGDDYAQVFAECGRNFGKTELIGYCLSRNAWMNPESPNYYFAPFAKQAREIIWEPRRLIAMVPPHWIADTNETEMRITLTNGSFIKCDGSDNTEAYRGVKVKRKGLVVYDEFKDFKRDFHIAMDPNLSEAKLLVVGTPPELEGQFTEVADEFKANPAKSYFNYPSSANPHTRKEWLEAKKAELYAKGEADVWEREYEAKRVKGGKRAIFPMIHSYPVTKHNELMQEVRRIRTKLEWYTITDPGTTTCFGTLFIGLNRYNREVYFLDEIYEQNQAKTTSRKIGARIKASESELVQTDRDERPPDWYRTCDEAAAWFINEINDAPHLNLFFAPTNKAATNKEQGLSLIKDALLKYKFKFSDRCIKLLWEMANYIKDDKGRIPKENDHLIDCVRYFLQAAAYSLDDKPEPIPEAKQEFFRGARIEDDFPEYFEDQEIRF